MMDMCRSTYIADNTFSKLNVDMEPDREYLCRYLYVPLPLNISSTVHVYIQVSL